MRLARREVVSMAVVACKDKDQILKTLVSVPTLVVYLYIHMRKKNIFHSLKSHFNSLHNNLLFFHSVELVNLGPHVFISACA